MSNATESSMPAPKTPLLTRAASTTATAPTITTTTSTTYGVIPTSSKPKPPFTRALTTTSPVPTPPTSTSRPLRPTRPSLWRRATTAATRTLELNPDDSLTHLNAPPPPTHWLETPHHDSLLRTWDSVQQEDAAAKPNTRKRSIAAQVLSVEKRMRKMYPLLVGGAQPLTGEWIEYVLGVALRAPFSSGEKMGRWEILASNSAGARMNWGPW